MRFAIIIIAAVWGILGLVSFTLARQRSLDAKLTVIYLILYPVLAIALFLNQPAPMWLSVPVVFGFIPWLMAPPHLWRVLKDPSATKADELIGIPRSYWAWGGAGAILLGIFFN